jgi:hypothetical protein
VPQLDGPEDREQREGRPAEEHDRLSQQHDPAAREPVGDDPAERPEHERRTELQRDGEPDEREVAGEFEHEPVDGDPGHPQRDAREEDRADQKPEVAHPEDRQNVPDGGSAPLDRDRCSEGRVTAAETHRTTPFGF